eukprot:365474-Chlamydomonas_euryale.AAC.8
MQGAGFTTEHNALGASASLVYLPDATQTLRAQASGSRHALERLATRQHGECCLPRGCERSSMLPYLCCASMAERRGHGVAVFWRTDTMHVGPAHYQRLLKAGLTLVVTRTCPHPPPPSSLL